MAGQVKKIIIVKDSRESNNQIYKFQSLEFAEKVIVVRDNLPCGDFSIAGKSLDIMIERKVLSDLISSFCGERREQFARMWERGKDIPYKFLLIEGIFAAAIDGEYRSALHPHSLISSLLSWSLKYKFNWFFVGNFAEGMQAVFYLLSNYNRLKQKGEL